MGGPSGNRALRALGASGGGSRWSDLRSAGVGRRELAAAVGAGLVSRVGTGGYVLPAAPTAVVAAIRHSSAVGCISALDLRGMHLLTVPTQPHLVPARARSDHGVVWHPRSRCDDLAVSLPVALAQMGICRSRVETLVALDAAVRTGRVDPDEVLAASRSGTGLAWSGRCVTWTRAPSPSSSRPSGRTCSSPGSSGSRCRSSSTTSAGSTC